MFSIKLLLITAFVFCLNFHCFSCLVADESEDAKLLVAKNILNNYIVQDLDITLKYTIYNVGNVPALNVKLEDGNFPSDKFDYVTGANVVRWSKISPANNVSHVAVVRPKIVGAYNFTHAIVSYVANEKSAKVQIGYSTEAGEVYVQRLKDYNRKFASHTIDWLMFAIMAAPSIVFPYFLWFNSKRRYECASKIKANKIN